VKTGEGETVKKKGTVVLLVAHCTTSRQTQTPANHKTQFKPQSLGCGCAKGFFPTTTNTKQQKTKITEKESYLRKSRIIATTGTH
jgi:hypothetical protein